MGDGFGATALSRCGARASSSQRPWPTCCHAPRAERLAATMTGELADCFATKAEGVGAIVAALEDVAADRPLLDLSHRRPAGRSAGPPARRPSWWRRPTGMPWPASPHAILEGRQRHARRYRLDDDRHHSASSTIGPPPLGRTDTERLASGELVYTGVKRSPVCAIARSVPYRGADCPLAQELFATAWDVYLMLGRLPEEPASRHTADGRPATREAACRRLARSICSDCETFNDRMPGWRRKPSRPSSSRCWRRRWPRVVERLPGPAAMLCHQRRGRIPGPAVDRGDRIRPPRSFRWASGWARSCRAWRRPMPWPCWPRNQRANEKLPMRRMIKVGGSLLDWPQLGPQLRAWLAACSGDDNLLVAGGGPAADWVREAQRQHALSDQAAHWLAIRAMQLSAGLLAELLPQATHLRRSGRACGPVATEES